MTPGLQIHLQREPTCIYTYTYIYMQTYIHIHTHTHTQMSTHMHMHKYTHVYTHIYGYQYTNDARHTHVIFDMLLSMKLCNITATSCINILCVGVTLCSIIVCGMDI